MSSGYDDNSTAAAHRAPWCSSITQWRNWKLVVKLTAVVLVPLIFALTLGALRIHGKIREADDYARLDTLVGTAASLRTTIGHLQEERTRAVGFLGRSDVSPSTLLGLHAATDKTITRIIPALQGQSATNPVVRFAFDDASRQLARMSALRDQVLTARMDAGNAVASYTEVIGSLLALDRTLVGQVSSPQLSSTANAVHALAKLSEEMRLQQSLVLLGVLRAGVSPDTLSDLNSSEIRRDEALKEFRAVATSQERAEYDRAFAQPPVLAREASLRLAMTGLRESTAAKKVSPRPQPAVPAPAWEVQSRDAATAITRVQSTMDEQLHMTAFSLYDEASNIAGLETVFLVSALLIATAVVIVIARQLVGSLVLLRRGALHAATTELPQAVSDIRTGHRSPTAITAVPVDTSEEIGQVARAFEAVHTQAVNLASEQADLRRSFRDSFINVSRRSQSLLERQLRLFEHLEGDEEDPDQLATLFQLDHLATRMRRNNENLMVLSGADLARRFPQAATLADLLRAAISEIEHYPRVIVEPLPDAKVVGYAGSDLVRLFAELLDNAANFSAPETSVTVTGHRRGDGSVGIDIVDRGIGMTDEELAIANRRLSAEGQGELSASRRRGLSVAGRLVARHGIGAELHRGPENTGVRATVSLRADLLLDHVGPQAGTRTNGFTQPRQAGHHQLEPTEETLVEEFDWEAAEQDAANKPGPARNGHRLPGSPPGTSRNHPSADPSDQGEHTQPRRGRHELFTPSKPVNGTNVPAADDEADARELATPIFDDLASAWFRAGQPSHHNDATETRLRWPARPGDGGASKGTSLPHVEVKFPYSQPPPSGSTEAAEGKGSTETTARWSFSSDHARIRAEEVSSAEPTEYTSVGLPRRTPQAHLVAGSAQAGQEERPPAGQRNPDLTRGRLSSFQRGLRKGRHGSNGRQPDTPADNTVAHSDGAETEHTGVDGCLDPNPAEQQDQSAHAAEPADYTRAGLPRRTPRAQLVPGSADDEPAEQVLQRDASLMRGRLASFQRGAREGRHSLREPGDTAAKDDQ